MDSYGQDEMLWWVAGGEGDVGGDAGGRRRKRDRKSERGEGGKLGKGRMDEEEKGG